jgi:tRNA(adenine34) deaminase
MEAGSMGDEYFMREALKLAEKALHDGEIPIGAVVVCGNRIIGKGYNQTQRLNDVTAHAEMIAITSAASFLNSKYLNECSLYVTLEPCLMCAGAIFWTQLEKLYYGAPDPKRGYMSAGNKVLHPKTVVSKGILEGPCSVLLKEFFASKRKN